MRLDLLHMAASEQDVVAAPFAVTVTGSGRGRAPLRPGGLESAGREWTAADAPGTAAAPSPFSSTAEGGTGSSGGGACVTLHGLGLWFDVDFGAETFDPARCREPGVAAAFAAAAASASAPPDSAATAAPDDDCPPPLEAVPEASPAPPAAAAAAAASSEPHHHVRLCTGPEHTPTHWVQTLLPFAAPLSVRVGDTVSGRLTMRRDVSNPREYHFALELDGSAHGGGGRRYAYHMN